MTQLYQENEKITFIKQQEILIRLGVIKPVVFDVGANVGQSIIQYKNMFPEAKLYSFEANDEVMSELKAVANVYTDVQLFNIALSDAVGETTFFITAVAEASSLLEPDPRLRSLSKARKYDFRSATVETTTLDVFCEQYALEGIDILKIDVQGAEMKVLHGAKQLLEHGRIKLLYIEVTIAPSYVAQMTLSELLVFTDACGYQLWDFFPFLYTRSGRAWTANAIFIHNTFVEYAETIGETYG